jgi:hypothetical protein
MRRLGLFALALAFVVAGILGCGDSGPKVEKGRNPFQEREDAYKEQQKDKTKGKSRRALE